MKKTWSKPLTQKQCDKLPAGVCVLVTWSGGNGPHEYVTGEPQNGHAFIDGLSSGDGELTGVGVAAPQTVVKVLEVVEGGRRAGKVTAWKARNK